MTIPILHTKIILPQRREEILSRQRLIDLVDELLDSKLIIVTAPAGYGKTSLLLDVAHHHEMPFCWLSLDPLDQDFQRFAVYFLAAIEQRFPEFGAQSRNLLQTLQQEKASQGEVEALIVNQIYQSIREHFAIVLDDYHLVDDSQAVNEFVNRFVQDVDQNCHLITLSRSLLPFPDLPLMVARSQVGGIGLQELAFRPAEVQALMLQNYHQTVPESVAVEITQKTEGWITGLLLSAQSMWQGMTDFLRVSRVSGVRLYDYLIHQVLDQQPPEVRDFLLRTSFFDEFNTELCVALLGNPPPGSAWPTILANVLEHNLFILPIGEEGNWLRYHHLFQDFLQNQLQAEQPEEVEKILRALIGIYVGRAEWEKAYATCLRLGEPNATADLLEGAAGAMTVSGRITLLRNWLEALPAGILEQRPILLARYGFLLSTQGSPSRGLWLLDQAIAHFRLAQNWPRLAWALIWRGHTQHVRANHPASLADVAEALSLAQGKEPNPEYDGIQAEAYRIRGQCYRLLGKLQEAIQDLSRSLQLYRDQADDQGANLVLLNLGAAHTDAGDFDAALSCYQQTLDYYQQQDNAFSLASVLNDLAFLNHLRGDYPQAFATYEEAMAKARQGANLRVEALVWIGMGDLYMDLDAQQAAADAYYQARSILERIGDQFLLFYLTLAEVAVARLNRDIPQARLLLAAARQIAAQDPSDYSQGLYSLEAGRLALVEQETWLASELLASAAKAFDAGGQRIEAGRAWLLLGAACFALGHGAGAAIHLDQAVQRLSGLENQHSLVPAARLVKPYLQALAASPQTGWQSQRLLEQVARFEEDIPHLRRRLRRRSPAASPDLPRLRIQALGKAQVLLGRKPVTSSDWQTQVTRDLFFLILSDRRGWNKEMLGEILWPESAPSQLRLRFKNTIYRLRRALQYDVVVFDGDRYSFNRKIDFEYDIEQFDEWLSRARGAANVDEKIQAYQAALQLYQGDYLPEVSEAWILPERERLRQDFLKAGLKLANLCQETRQFDRSLEICRRLIENDPYLEEAYLAAMQASAAAGNLPAAVHFYESLRQTLWEEIGVTPSAPIEALYRSLVG